MIAQAEFSPNVSVGISRTSSHSTHANNPNTSNNQSATGSLGLHGLETHPTINRIRYLIITHRLPLLGQLSHSDSPWINRLPKGFRQGTDDLVSAARLRYFFLEFKELHKAEKLLIPMTA